MSHERKRLFSKPVVTGNTNVPSLFHGWKEWNDGDFVVGKYHSKYESEYRKGKTVTKNMNYRVEVLDCNFKVKESKDSNKMISPIGKILVLNGNGKLIKFFDGTKETPGVEKGMIVDVVYAGKKRGNDKDDDTEYHNFHSLEAGWPDDSQPENHGTPATEEEAGGL